MVHISSFLQQSPDPIRAVPWDVRPSVAWLPPVAVFQALHDSTRETWAFTITSWRALADFQGEVDHQISANGKHDRRANDGVKAWARSPNIVRADRRIRDGKAPSFIGYRRPGAAHLQIFRLNSRADEGGARLIR